MEILLRGFAPSNADLSFHHRLNLHLTQRLAAVTPSPPKSRYQFSFSDSGAVRFEGLIIDDPPPSLTPLVESDSEWLRTTSRRAFAICSRPVKIRPSIAIATMHSRMRLSSGLVRYAQDNDLPRKLILPSQSPVIESDLCSPVSVLTQSPPSMIDLSSHITTIMDFDRLQDPCILLLTEETPQVFRLYVFSRSKLDLVLVYPCNLSAQVSFCKLHSPFFWNRTGIGTLCRSFVLGLELFPWSYKLLQTHQVDHTWRLLLSPSMVQYLSWSYFNLMGLAHIWYILWFIKLLLMLTYVSCSLLWLVIIILLLKNLDRLTSWVDYHLSFFLEWSESRNNHFNNDCVHRVKLRWTNLGYMFSMFSILCLWSEYTCSSLDSSQVGIDLCRVHRSNDNLGYHIHLFPFRLVLALTSSGQSKFRLYELPGFPLSSTFASPFGMFCVMGCIDILVFDHVYHRRLLIYHTFYQWFSLIDYWGTCIFLLKEVPFRYASLAIPSVVVCDLILQLVRGYWADMSSSDESKLALSVSLAFSLSHVNSILSLHLLGIWLFTYVVSLCFFIWFVIISGYGSLLLGISRFVSGIWLCPLIPTDLSASLNTRSFWFVCVLYFVCCVFC